MELNDENLMSFLQDFRAKLLTEGDADQIAAYFHSHGVQAFCGDAASCAIAVSMKNAIATEFNVPEANIHPSVASGLRAVIYQGETKVRAFVGSRPELYDFMNLFDRGYYPEIMHEDDTVGRTRNTKLRAAFVETNLPAESYYDWLRSDEAFAILQMM